MNRNPSSQNYKFGLVFGFKCFFFVISVFCHGLEKIATGLFKEFSINMTDHNLVHFNKTIPVVEPFSMAHAGEQVLCKDWDAPGSPVDQPAEMEWLKSC